MPAPTDSVPSPREDALACLAFSSNLSAMRSTLLLGGGCLALLACRMDDPCAAARATRAAATQRDVERVDSCRDPAYQSPEAVTYYGQTQNMARQPPPEPTSSDWCSYLIYDPVQGITQFTFPHDTLAVRTGPVTYDGVGSYAALLSTIGNGSVDISGELPDPLLRHFQCGAARRVDAGGHPFGHRRSHGPMRSALGSPEQNIVCVDDGSRGCFCSYDIASEPSGGGLSGRWSTQGALLTHFAGTKLIPSQADLCVSRRHDDDLGPQPRRDLGSGGPAHRHADAKRRIEPAPASPRDRRRRAGVRRRAAAAVRRRQGARRRAVAEDRGERAARRGAHRGGDRVQRLRARPAPRAGAAGKAGVELVRFPSLPGAVFTGHHPRRRRTAGACCASRPRPSSASGCRSRRRASCSTTWTRSTIGWRAGRSPGRRRLGGRVPARAQPRAARPRGEARGAQEPGRRRRVVVEGARLPRRARARARAAAC